VTADEAGGAGDKDRAHCRLLRLVLAWAIIGNFGKMSTEDEETVMTARASFGAIVLLLAPLASAQEIPTTAKKIVFLGDSITYSGQYVAILETEWLLADPKRSLDVLNLGLPSETVSGLSEKGHADGKFPRPDLHERLDRVLAKTHPDMIFACYGMNDAIYEPLDAQRFEKFKDGIRRLREKATKAGAKVIHVTPPVYDAAPLKNGSKYDDVLAAYSKWLIERRADGWEVIDLHGPMSAALMVCRVTHPDYTFAKDGVHPNLQGHIVIAKAIAKGTKPGRPLEVDADELTKGKTKRGELYRLVERREALRRDAWLADIGHLRPMPKAISIDAADKRAAELTTQIRKRLDEP
jgi:lysophospholipase L1-like esterase